MPVTRSMTRLNQQNIFNVLPPEVISHTLSFMDPLDYTGLPCTCRRALEIVNATVLAQLGTCQHTFELNNATLSAQLGVPAETLRGPEISMTGWRLRLYRHHEYEMLQTATCYGPDSDDDDL
jgi:hypothetical protein